MNNRIKPVSMLVSCLTLIIIVICLVSLVTHRNEFADRGGLDKGGFLELLNIERNAAACTPPPPTPTPTATPTPNPNCEDPCQAAVDAGLVDPDEIDGAVICCEGEKFSCQYIETPLP